MATFEEIIEQYNLEDKIAQWKHHAQAVKDESYTEAYGVKPMTLLADYIINNLLRQRGGYDGGEFSD